jgi:hypothetical protein
MPTSFTWNIIFFDGTFEYSNGELIKLLSQVQKLRHSTEDHGICMLTDLEKINNF